MNDRQRTIIGLVAIFSLVGIALLSLFLLDNTGGITYNTQGMANEEVIVISQTDFANIVSATDNKPFLLSVQGDQITLTADQDVPAAYVKFTCSAGSAPSVDGKSLSSQNPIYSVGSLSAQNPKTIKFAGCSAGTVSASPDGFDFSISQVIGQ